MHSISFIGFNGGAIKNKSDIFIHSKMENYGITEDRHILMHIITQFLRQKNLTKTSKKLNFNE